MEPRHFRFWPDGVPRTIDIPDQSLYQNLEASVERTPDKPAVIYYGRSLSYAELKRQVDYLAGFLHQRCNVNKGDRVLLDMQNSPQFIVAYYAIVRADAMVVPVNPMNLTEELRHYTGDSGARTILTAQELYPRIRPLLVDGLVDHVIVACYSEYAGQPEDFPGTERVLENLKLPESVSAAPQEIADIGVTLWRDAIATLLRPSGHTVRGDDRCVMPYTSGTTGHPKGCIHTHRTVQSTILIGSAWMQEQTNDDLVLLGTLPLFHVTGMQSCMNGAIQRGATVILMTRWDRDMAAELIQRYRVDAWTNISTMVIDFLGNPDLGRYDLSSLRYISGGGAAMPKAVAQRLNDLTGLSYIEGYGLSETMAPTHINPLHRPKQQCLGIPICNTDSRVVNPVTLKEMPAGEVGEIVSAGPQVFLGYWNNPQATAAAFIELDGKRFFRTGDLGYIDQEGYFFIVDRLKRMINASGFKVWPAEIETILYAHPAIHEVCVIASRDDRRGETVKALVVLTDAAKLSVSAEDIVNWAGDHMAAYKVPRLIEFADGLPKSATGKIQWRLLQESENSKQ